MTDSDDDNELDLKRLCVACVLIEGDVKIGRHPMACIYCRAHCWTCYTHAQVGNAICTRCADQ
jgi:hypothetical protein